MQYWYLHIHIANASLGNKNLTFPGILENSVIEALNIVVDYCVHHSLNNTYVWTINLMFNNGLEETV